MCVIPRSDFNIFMLWVQDAKVDLLEVEDPDSHATQSEKLSASDGIQFRQPLRNCLPLLSVARVPHGGSTHVSLERMMTKVSGGLSSRPAFLERRPLFSLMNKWSLPH